MTIKEKNVQNDKCLTCTWDEESDCLNCKINGKLNCKWDVKLLLKVYTILLPSMLLGFLGFIIVGLHVSWIPLLIDIIFWILFFFIIEIRIICSHCPYYTKEGKFLHCLANHGLPKLWAYHPEPMNIFEKLGFLGGAVFFVLFPVVTDLYGLFILWNQYNTVDITITTLTGLALLSSIAGVYFFTAVRRNVCPKCVNFSCPLNKVPKEIVDAYLENNPVMKEAWETAGYKLG